MHHKGAVSQFWCVALAYAGALMEGEILLPLGLSYENRKGMYRVGRIKNCELRHIAERLAKDQFLSDVFDVALLL